jgi:hypothetical protein
MLAIRLKLLSLLYISLIINTKYIQILYNFPFIQLDSATIPRKRNISTRSISEASKPKDPVFTAYAQTGLGVW